MNMHKPLRLNSNQQGIASIMVTLIIMVVLSLIVLGFAANTRREQRQSIDNQLKSQAYYAAESGINDAQKYIKTQLSSSTLIDPITDCVGSNSFPVKSGISNTIDGATTSYSCLLIDPTPPKITYANIASASSVAFPIKAPPASPAFTELNISWQGTAATRVYSACSSPAGNFPNDSGWPSQCSAGLLRIDLTPVNSLDRDSLIVNTKSFILQPVNGGGSASIGVGSIGAGDVIGVNCSATAIPAPTTPKDCNFKIGLSGSSDYYMRVRPIYRGASMQFTGQTGTKFKDAQAIVDSTGKATDILKRLQVVLPINILENQNNTTFGQAIESMNSLCKVYLVSPGTPASVTSDNTGDPSCQRTP